MNKIFFNLAISLLIPTHLLGKNAKIAFFVPHQGLRGTEVATYDYAHFNEIILGNESVIVSVDTQIPSENEYHHTTVHDKFLKRFGQNFYHCKNFDEMNELLKKLHVDIFYVLKAGDKDNKISKVCKNAIHAVFPGNIEVHGDIYACISRWLASQRPHLKLPYVPHIVSLTETKENLREKLGIPKHATVFGRHGGSTTFNIEFVHEAVKEVASKRKNIFFVFLNTNPFCNLKNVIFLPGTADIEYKTQFINTCDAMLHARKQGETFGLACGEFSIKNKPIITWALSPEKAHIDILRSEGIYYKTKKDLLKILYSFKKGQRKKCDAYSQFNPTKVMQKFNEIFIKPLVKSS